MKPGDLVYVLDSHAIYARIHPKGYLVESVGIISPGELGVIIEIAHPSYFLTFARIITPKCTGWINYILIQNIPM